jgi:hypothetical protein
MPEMPRGRFVWFDLVTPDPSAALDFYTRLVGWGSQAIEELDEPYTVLTREVGPVGGVMQLPEDAQAQGTPPHWLGLVSTPDVDATVAEARKLGGKVVEEPRDIPKAGRLATLADPQGAIFAVFTSIHETPAEDAAPQVGEFSWHELATTGYEAAFDFYHQLFGWEKRDAMDMGEGWIYQIFGRPGNETHLGGIFDKPAEMPGPPSWLYYVRVPDVDQAARRVEELGGRILNGPMEVPGGDKIVQALDPQGGAFALHSTGS